MQIEAGLMKQFVNKYSSWTGERNLLLCNENVKKWRNYPKNWSKRPLCL